MRRAEAATASSAAANAPPETRPHHRLIGRRQRDRLIGQGLLQRFARAVRGQRGRGRTEPAGHVGAETGQALFQRYARANQGRNLFVQGKQIIEGHGICIGKSVQEVAASRFRADLS